MNPDDGGGLLPFRLKPGEADRCWRIGDAERRGGKALLRMGDVMRSGDLMRCGETEYERRRGDDHDGDLDLEKLRLLRGPLDLERVLDLVHRRLLGV